MIVIRLVAPADPNGNSRAIDLLVNDGGLVSVMKEIHTRNWRHLKAISISVSANHYKKWLKYCDLPMSYYSGRNWE
jgi:hypothetical protein